MVTKTVTTRKFGGGVLFNLRVNFHSFSYKFTKFFRKFPFFLSFSCSSLVFYNSDYRIAFSLPYLICNTKKKQSKMLQNKRIIQLFRYARQFATESKEPPLIPPPPPQGNINMIRLAVIGSGLAFGAYVVSKPPNSYDTIFDEKR